ncbi:non-ribosomal peptide synthetase [Actinocorallia sp. B10E7]|uniref:non-ribosomal peptide synthetase n=1 Tax=Actinocorallia sp. B10E7 TaxID=3153558 RepID=UPI00325D4DCC
MTLSETEQTGDLLASDTSLPQIVARAAARWPDATAVVDENERISYTTLEERSELVARVLVQHGVGLESVVAVCLPRSVDLVVTELAVLKAGASYLPLDPADPAERRSAMAADSGARIVVTDDPEPWEAASGLSTLTPRPQEAVLDGPALPRPGPDNAAYVIYTSGSTGAPKGVVIPHRGIANLVSWHVETHEITPQDRCALLARVAFDASCWETWTTLAAGATLVAAPERVGSTGGDVVLDWLAEERITVAFLPPLLAERFYNSPIATRSALRVLLTGSDRVAQHPPVTLAAKVVNHYGPTEYSVIGTAGTIPPGLEGSPTIGTPISNTRVYILDEQGDPVPDGVTGRIHLAGNGLGRGYLGRPALTAERFVPDPFSGVPGTRMYDTGDQGRRRPDGAIEFAGRTDRQVKIRGYRIECGEIETALLAHPDLDAVAVTAVPDDNGALRLVAYLVPVPGAQPTENDLRSFLKRTLPDHMIPATYQKLDELPKNANGKVDHGALPAPHTERPDLGAPYMAPRNSGEEAMARIWSEVLNIGSIGVYDNFFELGGHSLLATEIVERIETELGVSGLDARVVFDYPTIAELTLSIS